MLGVSRPTALHQADRMSVMHFPPGHEEEDYCYLTTIGRSSREPRTIEIWFALAADVVYMLSGGGDAAQWVRNLRRNRHVEIRIARISCRGRARIVRAADESAQARRLLLAKYRPRTGRYRHWSGDVERWASASEAVVVAVELDDELSSDPAERVALTDTAR